MEKIFKFSAVFILVLISVGFTCANPTVNQAACLDRIFVEDAILIDSSSLRENCVLEIKTEEGRILAFSIVNGNFEQAQEFLAIHDGFGEESQILLIENQKVYERSKKDLPPTVYTTHSAASLRFKKISTSNFQLKIQKAVNCPFNLGTESQCGRVVDDVSCYCATFTKRNRPSQKTYCIEHGMSLLTLESYQEEQAMGAAWGTEVYFWTSLTDEKNEGTWIWESTNANLYPGFSYWCSKQPDDTGAFGGEDCMYINYDSNGCWNDGDCDKDDWNAICELHP